MTRHMVKPLRFLTRDVLLQEIPGHVSLSYLITGCPLGCKGCHSADSWDARRGESLDITTLQLHLEHSQSYVTCVLFMGGEWQPEALLDLLRVCKTRQLATALYSGLDECPMQFIPYLDFIKLGPWITELGGLASPSSNQRLYDLQQGLCLNPLFWPTPLPAEPMTTADLLRLGLKPPDMACHTAD